MRSPWQEPHPVQQRWVRPLCTALPAAKQKQVREKEDQDHEEDPEPSVRPNVSHTSLAPFWCCATLDASDRGVEPGEYSLCAGDCAVQYSRLYLVSAGSSLTFPRRSCTRGSWM